MDLSATVVTTKGIKDISTKDRGCLFNDESDLEFYKGYTFTNCRLECVIKEAEEEYHCIPWHLPKVSWTQFRKYLTFREKTQQHVTRGRRGTLLKKCEDNLQNAIVVSQVYFLQYLYFPLFCARVASLLSLHLPALVIISQSLITTF